MDFTRSMRHSPAGLLAVAAIGLMAANAVRAQTSDPFGTAATDWYNSLYNTGTPPASSGYGNPNSAYGNAYASPTAGFHQTGQVAQTRMPWSGVWWPRKQCDLAFTSFSDGLSPLEKYDTLVYDAYGRNPGSAAWEADPYNQHNDAPNPDRQDWAGHCNGLAAAGILEKEPTQTLAIPLRSQTPKVLKMGVASPAQARFGLFYNGGDIYQYRPVSTRQVNLTVADMKGWLSELYMNVYTMQFQNQDLLGHRDVAGYDPNDPGYKDIYPYYFHYLLQTFVKNRQQPIVAEVDLGGPINNHPVYAFDSQSTYYPAQRTYSVMTVVSMTDYAPAYQYVGTKTLQMTYYYSLVMDAAGRITGGDWLGPSVNNHPAFCWIPTGMAPAQYNYVNQALNAGFARYLIGH